MPDRLIVKLAPHRPGFIGIADCEAHMRREMWWDGRIVAWVSAIALADLRRQGHDVPVEAVRNTCLP